MTILHIAAECYPAAKAGGLGDVLGALPKYLNQIGINSTVVIPKYGNAWIKRRKTSRIFEDSIAMGDEVQVFAIEELKVNKLGFRLLFVDLPGLFDRPEIYEMEQGRPFPDETQRYIAFQKAVLNWLIFNEELPKIVHCHDHHTGLVPFMMKHCPKYGLLEKTPSVLTIHNAQYQGAFSWELKSLLPDFPDEYRGLLDYHDRINPLAAGIKCCWKLSTVSPSHFEELKSQPNGLEWLFHNENSKSIGLLNGIDVEVWDPEKDQNLKVQLNGSTTEFKQKNKDLICNAYDLDPSMPLFIFIGRLVYEKGVEIIPEAVAGLLNHHKASFFFLGTGKKMYEDLMLALADRYPEHVKAIIAYDERLAHELYAAADFLLMPSRVEPCGLNQMYAMRYGTVPVVRSTGGLRDSVVDIEEKNGYGFRFDHLDPNSLAYAMYRGIELYKKTRKFNSIRNKIMKLDFSWNKAARNYAKMYQTLISKKKLYDK